MKWISEKSTAEKNFLKRRTQTWTRNYNYQDKNYDTNFCSIQCGIKTLKIQEHGGCESGSLGAQPPIPNVKGTAWGTAWGELHGWDRFYSLNQNKILKGCAITIQTFAPILFATERPWEAILWHTWQGVANVSSWETKRWEQPKKVKFCKCFRTVSKTCGWQSKLSLGKGSFWLLMGLALGQLWMPKFMIRDLLL